MSDILEVQPGDLVLAATDFLQEAVATNDARSAFESAARLDPSVFANTSSSWKLANNYLDYYDEVLADLQLLGDHLAGFSDSLATAAVKFQEMEDANTIKVKKGDTLWALAKDKLGDPTRYPEIAKNNPAITNPDLIYPGEKIEVRPKSDLKLPWPPE